jgi:uncharacterized protein YbjT (DUF2867 family)
MPTSKKPLVVVAGATGNLGGRIARALVMRGARVRALVRQPRADDDHLRRHGIAIVEADYARADSLVRACSGAEVVVSALSGLRPVIVDAQTALVDAAIEAGVPRFIPSDYAIDFEKQPVGWNRNLDWRREFHAVLAGKRIASTSILNGAFLDLLTGEAPFLLPRLHRVLYWEHADQPMDFTSRDDVAAFTAEAALDPDAPPVLRIAGDTLTARELAAEATFATGKPYALLRAGDLRRLERIIRATRRIFPGKHDLYPAWQGMQYMHNMFAGRARLAPLDNHHYGRRAWTRARDVLLPSARAHEEVVAQ